MYVHFSDSTLKPVNLSACQVNLSNVDETLFPAFGKNVTGYRIDLEPGA